MIYLSLIILVVTLIVGIPVAFSFFIAAIFLILTLNYDPSFFLPYGFDRMSSTLLLAIPLFIMAGNLIEKGGAGESLINLVEVIFGKFKSGLGIVTVVACGLFGAIAGNASATITTIGTIILPRLKKAGYPAAFSASLLASSSVLGILIPPSSLMIVYAWISNTSVLAAFLSTVIPGIILIVCLSAINVWYINRHGIESVTKSDLTSTIEDEPSIVENESSIVGDELTLGKAIFNASPIALLAVIILGGIYGGIITPTEAAAVSVIYAFLIGLFFFKRLNFKIALSSLIHSAKMTGVIMLMFYASAMLNRLFTMEHLPDKLTTFMFTVSEHKLMVLLMLNLFLVIVGALMDDTSAVLLSTPILLPIALGIGVDPIHYAAIFSVNMGLGAVTPPAAPMLYLAGNMANARMYDMIKPTIITIIFAWTPTLIITTLFPDVALYLPRLLLDY